MCHVHVATTVSLSTAQPLDSYKLKRLGIHLNTDGSGHSQAFPELPRPYNEKGAYGFSMLVVAVLFYPLHHLRIVFQLGHQYN